VKVSHDPAEERLAMTLPPPPPSAAITNGHRCSNRFQGGATYTLLFYKHEDGTIGFVNGTANNQFDVLAGEWARAADFQRTTVRLHGTLELPYDFTASAIYLYGSGNYYQTSIATAPFGKPGTNRLNIGNPIVIPADVRGRFDGNAYVPRSGQLGVRFEF